MRVHHHHPSHLAYHRLVEARRRAHRFHRQLVFRLQLGHKCSQLFDPPPPQPALSVFLPRAHHKLRAMQIHSQIPFHRRLLLLLLGSGVDAALRRSPNSHSSSYWPYGDASIAGLTNLCVEVVPPHGTSPACNLSAPELLSWSLPPQNRYPIHAISVVTIWRGPAGNLTFRRRTPCQDAGSLPTHECRAAAHVHTGLRPRLSVRPSGTRSHAGGIWSIWRCFGPPRRRHSRAVHHWPSGI